MANTPFKGTFQYDSEASGAETTDLSLNYMSMALGPERAVVERGAVLQTDHRSAITGSTAVPFELTLVELTVAQIAELIVHWDNKDLMEAICRPLAGVKSTTNPEIRVQFFPPNAPTLPTVIDTYYEYSTGSINATGFSWDDSSTVVTIGTLLTT